MSNTDAKIVERKLIPVELRAFCLKCERELSLFNDPTNRQNDPAFYSLYECRNCLTTYLFEFRYPRIEFRYADAPEKVCDVVIQPT